MAMASGPQQLAKEADGGETVAPGLHENVNDHAVLIHGVPLDSAARH
jgi:hypothetical protein